jgi:hypothetical protein
MLESLKRGFTNKRAAIHDDHLPNGRILSFMCINMDLNQATRHFYSVELTNAERLDASALMDSLRDAGVVPMNTNLGHFIKECFARGLNDYRKDLVRHD